jgi:hypothetical protein
MDIKKRVKSEIENMITTSENIQKSSKDEKGVKFWKGYRLACKELQQFINELHESI